MSPNFNPLLEGDGGDSPDEDEKDEQDILDERDEKEDLLTGDTNLLSNIRIKHMQLISRTWIVASILVQSLILVCAYLVFWQVTLFHLANHCGNLTVLFFWPHDDPNAKEGDYDFNHSGTRYWWFHFSKV